MFTGIVQSQGWILTLEDSGEGKDISIRCPDIEREIDTGDSVAVNGVCLTVEEVEPEEPILHVHVVRETLRQTNLGKLDIGDQVNIEPSLRAGDPLSGHFVMGHVDDTGRVDQIDERDQEKTMWIKAPEQVMKYVVRKGCVALDGVSLTPVEIEENRFSVELIPETLQQTTLGDRKMEEEVNIEVDLVARYVEDRMNEE